MLDINWIRKNPQEFDSAMLARGAKFKAESPTKRKEKSWL